MLIAFIKIFGWLLANLPLFLVEFQCKFLGYIIFTFLTKRRRILLSNLHHAFPEKTLAWHRKIGLESCRRTVEMGLLSLALPYFSKERLRRHFTLSTYLERSWEEAAKRNQFESTLAVLPHFSMLEALTVLPALRDLPLPKLGAIFRPFSNIKLNRWVKQTRERWGVHLLSRKAGFNQAMSLLSEGGMLAVLFDQEAGKHGVLTTFFDRICSASKLSGLLSHKFDTKVYAFYPKRKSFWKAELEIELLESTSDPVSSTLVTNAWLENKLRESDNFCAGLALAPRPLAYTVSPSESSKAAC